MTNVIMATSLKDLVMKVRKHVRLPIWALEEGSEIVIQREKTHHRTLQYYSIKIELCAPH